ncbi:MAG TPA: fumarate reductase subunit C [bacterium]|nr:fumarate reductase subunit C [bacterium]
MSRPYHRPMPANWWLTNRAYFMFMIRELTSVFIAIYVVLILVLINRIAAGPDAYRAYLAFLATPGMLVFHIVALAAALFHSITWFNLAPKGLAVRVGERRVPDAVIVGSNFAAWIILSVLLAWIVL